MKFILFICILAVGLSAYSFFSKLSNPYYVEVSCYKAGQLVFKDKKHEVTIVATAPDKSRFDKCEIMNVD